LKRGESLPDATEAAEDEHAELKDDPDEGPLLWLAIAHAQWKYGTVAPRVLEQVRDDIENGRGLERWEEDPRGLEKRKAALAKFLAKIESPNPKPSRLPKLVIRKAPFREGDCLSVSLPNGLYTAALVLREDNSNPELGMNLIGSLDYLGRTPPSMRVFKRKKWLTRPYRYIDKVRFDEKRQAYAAKESRWRKEREIHWYLPVRLKNEMKRFTVVGNTGKLAFAPRHRKSSASWESLGEDVLWLRGQGRGGKA
jgi:hypothetical protein